MDSSLKRMVSLKSVFFSVLFFGGLVLNVSCTKPTEVSSLQKAANLNPESNSTSTPASGGQEVSNESKGASDTAATSKNADSVLADRGRSVYMSSCIACHNSDPSKPGAVGPDVKGSSRELIEARVMRAEYPPGYKPKRPSHAMAALPQFKNDIDALAAFLK